MEQEKRRVEIVEEYLRGGVSLRELGRRKGVTPVTLHRWVKRYEAGLGCGPPGKGKGKDSKRVAEEPKEIKRLESKLEEARLEAGLYKAMIEIAERELGIAIRKKRGAKR
jgi:transposase-like protein